MGGWAPIIVIENKPGASGSIGTAQVAKSPPDCSNWLFVFDTHAVNTFLQKLSLDPEKDLEPVLLIGTAPTVVATHPGHSFQTFVDVIATAKAKPDSVTYGSIGSGSLGHLTMVLLSARRCQNGACALSQRIAGDRRQRNRMNYQLFS